MMEEQAAIRPVESCGDDMIQNRLTLCLMD
jgi:predicted restriction endonuclease